MSIKLLIDSASDISKEEASKLGVEMIPLVVSYDGKDYYDGVDLTSTDFYNLLDKNKDLPKTSQINPFRFEEEFERLTSNGDEVICITISGNLSGTAISAKTAAENYKDKVYVIDSNNVAMGERLLLNYAQRLINEGKSAKEVVDELERVKDKVKILAVIDTLTYLKKGGRISATTAFAGELLNIKPIVCLVDGKVEMIGKARGSKKAFSFINDYVNDKGGIDLTMPYGVLYSGNDEEKVEKYIEYSNSIWNGTGVNKHKLGCTIGTHVGPGAVGIAFFEK